MATGKLTLKIAPAMALMLLTGRPLGSRRVIGGRWPASAAVDRMVSSISSAEMTPLEELVTAVLRCSPCRHSSARQRGCSFSSARHSAVSGMRSLLMSAAS
eukprot:scaffold311140_cov27-Tisochrysis_lutea.AAC.1